MSGPPPPRIPIGQVNPAAYAGSALMALPPEILLVVFDEAFRAADAPEDLNLLLACRWFYLSASPILAQQRRTMVHTIPDVVWRNPNNATRDQQVLQSLTLATRQSIDIVRFVGRNNSLFTWMPRFALTSLAALQIRPTHVILFDAFTPHPLHADVDALADNARDIVRNVPRVRRITIANVPQSRVINVGDWLLNSFFESAVEMETMFNGIQAEFILSGRVCIDVVVPIQVPGRVQVPVVTVHITTRSM